MKLSKNMKITMLFLFTLCVISIFIIHTRNVKVEYLQKEIKTSIEEKLDKNNPKENSEDEVMFENGEIGFIIIPILDLKAPIKEGTTSEILKYSVGTFRIEL